MVSVAIVEDDSVSAQLLTTYLIRFTKEFGTFFKVTEFKDAVSFLESRLPPFQVVFMDIELPHMNGMEAARRLRETDKQIILVFVTNMAQYAVKGYEVDALDFVVKPVSYPDFAFKLKRVLNTLKANEDREITIALSKNYICRVSSSRLLYVEVSGHSLRYHLTDNVWEGGGSLSKAEEYLTAWSFLRCNNCYLINPRHVVWVRGHTVKVGSDELQISHPKRKEFMQGMAQWLAKGGK